MDALKLCMKKGNEIVVVYVKNPSASLTALHSHGNAADLGMDNHLESQVSKTYADILGCLQLSQRHLRSEGERHYTVNCPILVIHGTDDEILDWSHGKQLWELCKGKYEILWLKGGDSIRP
ncbi:hypothetical protein CK203_060074 [Vitis vinifera]|uniref:Serine hydrolase domain-containing protein n=1 Tax=Vitis vinifera TaxID=29760 RepID=A0A438GK18_VITVI|nr:hypothetical protein CK203_060074 [Vitis vinifera]